MTTPLAACPRCSFGVSPVATSCPHCGEPLLGIGVGSSGQMEMHPEVASEITRGVWLVAVSGLMAWIPCIGIGFALVALIVGFQCLKAGQWGSVMPLGWSIPLWFGFGSALTITLIWAWAFLLPSSPK